MSIFSDLISGGFKGIGDAASAIIKDFKADPTKIVEAEAKLKELDLQIEETKLKLDSEIEQAYLKDVQDARSANVKIQESDKASWLSKNVGYIIDLFLAALWGTVTVILFLKIFKVAATEVDMVSLMALHGTVTAVFMTIVNFHRGSSKSSADKDRTIHTMINK